MREKKQYHKWSDEDLGILRKSVERYGFAEGCKIAADLLDLTLASCRTQSSLHGFKNTTMTDTTKSFKSTVTEPLPSKVFEDPDITAYVTIKEPKKADVEKKKYRKHLAQEEEVQLAEFLRKEISVNPNNLHEAFVKCQKKFGFKSISSINNRWYGYKKGCTDFSKFPSCKDNLGIVYSIVGSNSTINGKNSKKPTHKKTSWILSIITKMFNKKLIG